MRKFQFLKQIAIHLSFFLNSGCSDLSGFVFHSVSSLVESHNHPHIVSESSVQKPNQNIEFSVFGPGETAAYSWTHSLGNVPGRCVEVQGRAGVRYTLNCPTEGLLRVTAVVTENNISLVAGEYTVDLRNEGSQVPTPPGGSQTPTPTTSPRPTATPTPPPSTSVSLTVEFEIRAGTGLANDWNSPETQVETFIGQTLILKNRDSVGHTMHSFGDPCSHGGYIEPGQNGSCKIESAFSWETAGPQHYEHARPNFNEGSYFYLKAYDGVKLYIQNCASCHGPLATSTRRGMTPVDITRALSTIPAMLSRPDLIKLTPRQIEAISHALRR